ncbi:MAG: TorF family putative porin [Deltaproteobacteria bacterium]|nr:TorF family putative porin [Deltaproteobacteria bacterium]
MLRGKLIAVLALLVMLAFIPAKSNAADVEGELTVDILNTYVWRGINFGGNEGVIQPGLGASFGGFSIGFWSDYDAEMNKHVETDFMLSYSTEARGIGLEFGYIYYALDGALDTTEIYLGVSFDYILNPEVTLYYDLKEGDGAFLVVGIGHTFEISEDLSLDLSASSGVNFGNEVMGYNEDGETFNGMYYGELGAAVNVEITDSITITPKIAYSFALGDDGKFAIESFNGGSGITSDETAILYGGVGVAVSF